MQRASRTLVPASMALMLLGAVPTVAPQDAPSRTDDPAPREIGLEERAGTRLAQLDITVIGPAEAITQLDPDDFKVKIHFRRITDFQLDRLCTPRPPDRKEKKNEVEVTDVAAAPGPSASYLFYFDQAFLTMEGRLRSLQVARSLVDRLITDTSWLGSKGLTIQPVAPAALPRSFLSSLDSVVSVRMGVKRYAGSLRSFSIRVIPSIRGMFTSVSTSSTASRWAIS